MQRRLGFEIKTLSQMHRHEFDRMKAELFADSETAVNGWILRFLYDNRERDVFQRDIEEHFHLRRSTVSTMIQTMEKNGLLLRQSVACDARLKKLVLTPSALQLHERICRGIEEMGARICNGISDEEMNIFYSVIDRMKANMSTEETV